MAVFSTVSFSALPVLFPKVCDSQTMDYKALLPAPSAHTDAPRTLSVRNVSDSGSPFLSYTVLSF